MRITGELEKEILSVLNILRSATVQHIHGLLNERGMNIAYTTVSTVLSRLYAKGLLGRSDERFRGGVRYCYHYKDFEQEYLNGIVEGVVKLFGEKSVSHLVERLEARLPDRRKKKRVG